MRNSERPDAARADIWRNKHSTRLHLKYLIQLLQGWARSRGPRPEIGGNIQTGSFISLNRIWQSQMLQLCFERGRKIFMPV